MGGLDASYYDQYGLGNYFRQRNQNTKQTITSYNVNSQEVISGTNPSVGIGADDRAGCAILWLLRDSGHNLLVLDGEETGTQGARFLVKKHPAIRDAINKSRFCMEFDRRGKDDYKCYEIPVSDDFKTYIESKTNFKDAGTNSVTDISILCENVCGVNMSVGYYNEHSPREHLVVDEWLNTLNLTRQITSERIPKFNLDEQVRERLRKQKEMRWQSIGYGWDDSEWRDIFAKYDIGLTKKHDAESKPLEKEPQ